jgi:hypothetical protein
MDGGTVRSQTAVRYTGTGQAWQFSPTSSDRSATFPVREAIAQFAVAAGSAVTITAKMRRSNTALTFGLLVRGYQIAGVDADVTSNMTASADTWETVSLTFTPSEAGVIEVEAVAYGGTTHSGYVDDITVAQ